MHNHDYIVLENQWENVLEYGTRIYCWNYSVLTYLLISIFNVCYITHIYGSNHNQKYQTNHSKIYFNSLYSIPWDVLEHFND